MSGYPIPLLRLMPTHYAVDDRDEVFGRTKKFMCPGIDASISVGRQYYEADHGSEKV